MVVMAATLSACTSNNNSNNATNRASENNSSGIIRNSNAALINDNADKKITNINIIPTGFSPRTVTVSAGDTITWTNNDTRSHYVAPNNHPNHREYSGMWDDDGTGNISVGQTYSVVLGQPGTYNYHDHLNAGLTGTIIVE